MIYGICNLSSVPCRKEPSDSSEMVSQLLFGEHYEILHEQERWVNIRTIHDNYTCWISSNQVHYISPTFGEAISYSTARSTVSDVLSVVSHNNEITSVLLGSSLPYYRAGSFNIEQQEYEYSGEVANAKGTRAEIVNFAMNYINTPYMWGGRSPFGIDCSGLTQMCYKLAGKQLPRDAYQQADLGIPLSFIEEAQAGDLAFFDNVDGRIIHVGIITGQGTLIHASGKVKINPLDHFGIYDPELKKYTHRLRLLKSYL
jgi:gamma-D-glutamyl-L-lysine dipeptidyl-peptidase